MAVSLDLEVLPPYSSPKWCDHGPVVKTCSRCDPSERSGRIRAREAKDQANRARGVKPQAGLLEASERLADKEGGD